MNMADVFCLLEYIVRVEMNKLAGCRSTYDTEPQGHCHSAFILVLLLRTTSSPFTNPEPVTLVSISKVLIASKISMYIFEKEARKFVFEVRRVLNKK